MKEIAKKYPKVARKFINDCRHILKELDPEGFYEYGDYFDWFSELPFRLIAWVLIDEFFPKHGIEIERLMIYDFDEHKHFVFYRVLYEDNKRLIPVGTFKIPPKAIEKAFELLERKLNE